MRRLLFAILSGLCVLALWLVMAAAEPSLRVPVVGLPCEGCEAVFDGLPATLKSESRIAPPDEPGEAMRLAGTVFDKDGRPAPGVIVYAYHTNARGIYPPDDRAGWSAGSRHGRLRGWARTDEAGHYRFDTIRPAGYPDSGIPAHVHMHVIEVGCCTYYIDEVHLLDDPRLKPADRTRFSQGRGGSGLIMPERDASGRWNVTRDIRLGEGIPGYATDR